jgi:hypothetical protein
MGRREERQVSWGDLTLLDALGSGMFIPPAECADGLLGWQRGICAVAEAPGG